MPNRTARLVKIHDDLSIPVEEINVYNTWFQAAQEAIRLNKIESCFDKASYYYKALIMKKIIYVDFDGVINSYQTKFNQANPGDLPDPPIPGAIEWLTEAVEHFKIVIFTCRMLQPESEAAIHNWFFKHGMPNNVIDQLSFSCTKRGAEVYIDDRAWRFEGKFPTLDELNAFKPWNKI